MEAILTTELQQKEMTESNDLESKIDEWPINQELTGSELYRYTLEMLDVNLVGAYTGGRVIELLDKIGQSKKVRLITAADEQDLGHIFQGYYKVSRKPGFVIVTSGPGGTNSATPIKDAHSDSDALILTIGQVSLEAIEDGEEAFQGALMVEPFKFWSKWSYRIKNVNEIQSVLKTAYNISITGRPGPVVLELPSTIAQLQKTILKHIDDVPLMQIESKKPRVYSKVKIRETNLDYLIKSINRSERPAIIAGGGVYNSNASGELLSLSELIDAPFMTTLMLLSTMPEHKLNLGLPGMHGPPENNLAIYNSDMLIYIGGRLDDRIILDPEKFAPYAEIFWIEPNNPGIGSKIAKRVQKIEADAKHSLKYLISNIKQLEHEEWLQQIFLWREKYPMPNHIHRKVIEETRYFVDIYEKSEPFITTGVGAHQMILAVSWPFNPDKDKRMLLTPGGLGTMGAGIPHAVGALLADQTRSAYVFNGDGSSVMDQRGKLSAYHLKKYRMIPDNIGIKEIVFRDNSLAMVENWQNHFWNGNKIVSELNLPEGYFCHMALQNEFTYFLVDYTNPEINDLLLDLRNFMSKNNSFNSNYSKLKETFKELLKLEEIYLSILHEKNIPIIEEFVKYRGNSLLEVRILPQGVLPMIPSTKSVEQIRLPYGMKLDPGDLLVGKL